MKSLKGEIPGIYSRLDSLRMRGYNPKPEQPPSKSGKEARIPFYDR